MRVFIICGFFCFFLGGCQIDYLLKSGYHQALLLKSQEPIADIINDDKLSADQKRKLNLIIQAKEFAETDLGLTKTQNYTTYVSLDRKYVSYIAQVAYPFELKYKLWHFPVVGDVPYKGFFTSEEAKTEAAIFDKDGFDTHVRGVRAFSTLGWLKDPVLSPMLDYDDDELVNLIIHETTHATLYIKSNADFNEQMATFVGNKGTELFYKKREGENSPTLRKIIEKNTDEEIFSKFITDELGLLSDWYKSNEGKTTKEEKEKRLSTIQEKFKKLKFKTDQLEYFKTLKLNNAILLGYKTYVNDLSKFEDLFRKKNSSMREFIETLKKLESSKSPEKDVLLVLQ